MSSVFKTNLGLLARIAKMLDFPPDTFGSIPFVELKGNCEATVYGCKRVIDYSEGCVKLKTVKNNIVIEGEKLVLSDFTAGSVSVNGDIKCVRFSCHD